MLKRAVSVQAFYCQSAGKCQRLGAFSKASLWLATELQTRRLLIPAELPFSEKTKEAIETFRMLRHLQQEFGLKVCQTYIISMSHEASDLLEVLLLAVQIQILYHYLR